MHCTFPQAASLWRRVCFPLPHLAGFVLALAVVVLVSLTVSPGWAQKTDQPAPPKPPAATPAQPEPPRDWQVILSMHQETLVQQASRIKSMAVLQTANLRRFRADLSVLQGKLDELGLIISLSGGNPWELRAVLNDMTAADDPEMAGLGQAGELALDAGTARGEAPGN